MTTETFTTGTGTFTVPSGVTSVEIEISGHGADGAEASGGGGGGGGGGYASVVLSVAPDDEIPWSAVAASPITAIFGGVTYTGNPASPGVAGVGGNGGTNSAVGGSWDVDLAGDDGADAAFDEGGKGGDSATGALGGNGGNANASGENGQSVGGGGGGAGDNGSPAGLGSGGQISFIYTASGSTYTLPVDQSDVVVTANDVELRRAATSLKRWQDITNWPDIPDELVDIEIGPESPPVCFGFGGEVEVPYGISSPYSVRFENYAGQGANANNYLDFVVTHSNAAVRAAWRDSYGGES